MYVHNTRLGRFRYFVLDNNVKLRSSVMSKPKRLGTPFYVYVSTQAFYPMGLSAVVDNAKVKKIT